MEVHINDASSVSFVDLMHPRAQDEPYHLPISSIRAKDLVGSNVDEISEVSRLEGQLLEMSPRQMTTCGHLERRLSVCPPPVKRTPFLRTNSEFNVLGLVGLV